MSSLDSTEIMECLKKQKTLLIVISVSVIVMFLCVMMGNPRALGFLYWHHIPEVLAIYFIGVISARLKMKTWIIALMFFSPISLWVFVGLIFQSILYAIVGMVVSAIILQPLLVGHWVGKKHIMERLKQ